VLVRLTPTGKDLAEDAMGTLIDAQAAGIQGLDETERAAMAGLLRSLLVALGDTPAFRPAIVAKRR
jgi:hypothetical protein